MTSIATLAGLQPHGIPRAEWVRRFCDKVKQVAGVDDDIAQAEVEGWPERDEQPGGSEDWLTEQPESAALESLSYWTDDEGGAE